MKTAADIARIAKASNVNVQQIEAEIEAYANRKANAAAARAVQYSARTVSSVLDLMFDSPLSRDQRQRERVSTYRGGLNGYGS